MSRFLSLAEAVESTIRDGDTVAMEGFTHLIPYAAGHEIIRQRRRHLTLIRMTPDLIYDQLIGMGCADKLVFSWVGNPGVGSLHRFRDAYENGWPAPITIEEHSHAAMANAYEAGAAGLPLRDLPRLSRRRPAEGESEHQAHHLSVHRRAAGGRAGDPAGRGGDPCAQGGPRRQRADRRHRRRAEGGGAGGQALDRDGRGDRRGFRRAQPQCGDPAELDRRRDRLRAGRRASLLRARLLQARQRLLQGLGRDRPRPRQLPRLDEDERAGQGARRRSPCTLRPQASAQLRAE